MPTCQISVIYLIVCRKKGDLGKNIVKLFLLTPLGGLIPPTLAMRSSKIYTWSDSNGSWLHPRALQSSKCQPYIKLLTFWTQHPPSNWVFGFGFSNGCPPFSSRFTFICQAPIGETNPVFHEESGHVIKISHQHI